MFLYLHFRSDRKEYRISSLEKKDYRFLFIIGILRISLVYYFYYISIGYLSGVKASILTSSSTFFTVFITPFIVKSDGFTKEKIIALILGFLGIIVANYNGEFDVSFTLKGEGYMLLSGLFTALSEVLIKPKGKGISAPIITWGQLLFGSIGLLILGYFNLEKRISWTFLSIVLLIYSAMISAVAFIIWYELLKVNDSGELAIYRLFIPLFGSIISSLLIPSEYLNISLFFGLIFVILGIVVLNLDNLKKKFIK